MKILASFVLGMALFFSALAPARANAAQERLKAARVQQVLAQRAATVRKILDHFEVGYETGKAGVPVRIKLSGKSYDVMAISLKPVRRDDGALGYDLAIATMDGKLVLHAG